MLLQKHFLTDYESNLPINNDHNCSSLLTSIIKSKNLRKPGEQNYLQIQDLLRLCSSFLLISTRTELHCLSPLLPTKNSPVKD